MAFPALLRKLFAHDGAGPKLKDSLLPVHYAVCEAAADNAAKTVTIDDFNLAEGAVVWIKFTNDNEAETPTLNINDTGAFALCDKGEAIKASALVANGVYSFVYDGTVWNLAGGSGSGGGTVAQDGNTSTGTGSDLDFDNLVTAGKYFVTTTEESTGTPMDGYAREYWVTVSTYTSGSNTYILQEARMHNTSSSNATDGSAQCKARCGTNGTWGPWEYAYTQFAG